MTCLIELLGGPADGMLIDLPDFEAWPEVFSYLIPVVDLASHANDLSTDLIYRSYAYCASDRVGGRGRRIYAWDGRPPGR